MTHSIIVQLSCMNSWHEYINWMACGDLNTRNECVYLYTAAIYKIPDLFKRIDLTI